MSNPEKGHVGPHPRSARYEHATQAQSPAPSDEDPHAGHGEHLAYIGQDGQAGHDGHDRHAGHGAHGEMFRRRFWFSLVLSPVASRQDARVGAFVASRKRARFVTGGGAPSPALLVARVKSCAVNA